MGGNTGVQRVTVRARDFSYAPNSFSARPGAVQVTFVNEGLEPHTFNVKNANYRGELFNSRTVQPGETAVLDFTIVEPGQYTLFCILYGHQNKGQDGVLTVLP